MTQINEVLDQLRVESINGHELIFGNDGVLYEAALTACTTLGYSLGTMTVDIARKIKNDWTLDFHFWSGINDVIDEGVFVTENGASFDKPVVDNSDTADGVLIAISTDSDELIFRAGDRDTVRASYFCTRALRTSFISKLTEQ